MVRIKELKSQYNDDNEALAKILVCEKQVKDTKCWRQYYGKEKKIFFEFSCPFHSKRYTTSGTSSPFTLIHINDLK